MIQPKGNSLKLVALLQLCRLSNVLSAVTNVLMGYLWIRGSWQPVPGVLVLCLASGCFYVAGMVLNDFFDYEHDKSKGSKRPLVTGKVSLNTVRIIGFGAWLLGIVIAMTVLLLQQALFQSHDVSFAGSVAVVGALSISILIYDRFSKQTIFAPWLMGACRCFNVSLGMVAGGWLTGEGEQNLKVVDVFLLLGVLMYVSGITWYASKETEFGNRWRLSLGLASILIAYCVWAVIPWIPDCISRIGASELATDHWYWLLALLMMPAFTRLARGLHNPTARNIQSAVITSLFTIIVIDGMFCWLIKTSQPAYSIIIFAMLLPTIALGRLARPT